MALAATTDVEAALGRSLAASETNRCNALLLLASSAVEDHTGFRFEPGSYTVGRLVRGGKVKLPAKVASVSAVREVDECDGSAAVVASSDYTLRGSTLYGLRSGRVEVDFTVAAAVPDDVKGVVAGVVANTLAAPPVGAQSETTGPFTISYVSNSGRVFLAASDKAVLRKYRQARPALGLYG